MNRPTFLILILSTTITLISCASLTPAQVNSTLPTLTKSKYFTQTQADEAVRTQKCKYLVKGRKYSASVQMTAQGDLRKGAQGIDEWVRLDGGNAYVLVNFTWVAIDDLGTSQLHLEFHTMLCE
jgi:hypothetical protein